MGYHICYRVDQLCLISNFLYIFIHLETCLIFFFIFFIDTEATVMTKALSNTDVFIKAVENWYFSLISRRKAQIPPPPNKIRVRDKMAYWKTYLLPFRCRSISTRRSARWWQGG